MNCPDCGGPCWDNRETKKNPKAPDYRCKDKNCGKAIWLPKNQQSAPPAPATGHAPPAGPRGLQGLTPQQQANARQMVRSSYMLTMAYMAGAMAKLAKEQGIPLDMGHVQAATFSVYNTMDKKGLIPSHLKAASEDRPAPKREPEPPRRAPEPPPINDDDYPEDSSDMGELPF